VTRDEKEKEMIPGAFQKIPNPKHQCPNDQNEEKKRQCLCLGHSVIGICDLFGNWDLELGASLQVRR
jgi:hypothetical protein